MQDDAPISSSQELPLSQELFSEFFTDSIEQLGELNCDDISAIFEDWKKEGVMDQNNSLKFRNTTSVTHESTCPSVLETDVASSSVAPAVPSVIPNAIPFPCFPATKNWLGDYGFNIYFEPQKQRVFEKKVAWMYSDVRDKLYVMKSMPFPLNFITDIKPLATPGPLEIRAQAIFSHPEHANDVVKRCLLHIDDDKQAGISSPEHLVRCESHLAKYTVCGNTQQCSVTIPFEGPPIGQSYSSYLFKFTCFSSCPGVLNRRPIIVIFTLEKGGEVIGRRSLDVKICACPARDCRNDDKLMVQKNKEKKSGKKRKADSEIPPYMSEVSKFFNKMSESARKTNRLPNKDGYYTIKVKDKSAFELLRHVNQLYELSKSMQQLSPDLLSNLQALRKKAKKGTDTDGSD